MRLSFASFLSVSTRVHPCQKAEAGAGSFLIRRGCFEEHHSRDLSCSLIAKPYVWRVIGVRSPAQPDSLFDKSRALNHLS
jgi:hypothetical protein